MPEFKVGDVVQLKSGGPKMTVSEVSENTIRVIYYDESAVEKNYFPMVTFGSSSLVLSEEAQCRNEYCPHYADENGQYDDDKYCVDDGVPECDVVDTEDMLLIIHGDLLAEGHDDLAKEIWNLKNEYQKREVSRADKD